MQRQGVFWIGIAVALGLGLGLAAVVLVSRTSEDNPHGRMSVGVIALAFVSACRTACWIWRGEISPNRR